MTGSESRERDRRAARRAAGAPGQPAAGQRLLRARPPARARTTRSRRRRATRRRSRGPRPTRGRTGPCRAGWSRTRTRTRTRSAPTSTTPELDKDLWRFRRIAARGLFEPGAYPSDITLVNWPQIDYTDAPVLDGSDAGARALSLHFLRWMQTGAPRAAAARRRRRRHARRPREGAVRARGAADRGAAHGGRAGHRARRARRARRRGGPRRAWGSATTGSTCTRRPAGTPTSTSPAARSSSRSRALIPQRLENLIAAGKCLGTTHITNGAFRLHPVEWNAGEAAGHLAAFCAGRRRPAARGRRAAGAARPLPGRAGRRRDRARLAGCDPAREYADAQRGRRPRSARPRHHPRQRRPLRAADPLRPRPARRRATTCSSPRATLDGGPRPRAGLRRPDLRRAAARGARADLRLAARDLDSRRGEPPRRHRGCSSASTTAPRALDDLCAIVADWRPDLVLSECAEFAGPLAAEHAGCPSPSSASGSARSRREFIAVAVAALAPLARGSGCPTEPEAQRRLPHARAAAARRRPAPRTRAASASGRSAVEPLPDWWGGDDAPLVYLTLGTVAPQMGFFPGALPRGGRRARARCRSACSSPPAATHDPAAARPAARATSTPSAGSRRRR